MDTCPEMIIFDFGNTLVCEPDYNSLRGTQAVMQYVLENTRGLTAEEVNQVAVQLFRRIRNHTRETQVEIHYHQFITMLYEHLGIQLSLAPQDCERVYWDHAAPGKLMPNITELLAYIRTRGIRTGVISNITFSGESLRYRLEQLLPEHRFEFILASSEYVFRKPSPVIFETAQMKAGLPNSRIWYCGDNVRTDIQGASDAGLFPVWYKNGMELSYNGEPIGKAPDCPHLLITNWLQLIEVLEGVCEDGAGS